MSNFDFLPTTFRDLAESATRAESHIHGDPRAACFHARFALENAVHWLYQHDGALAMPYDQSLGALLHASAFQNLLPQAVFQKARVIQKMGNQAVHNRRQVRQFDALQVVRELHHLCYWMARTYSPEADLSGAVWDDAEVPRPVKANAVVPRSELEAAERRLAEQNERALKEQEERAALDEEVQRLREQLAGVRREAEAKPDPHDYDEADTRRYLIDVELRRAGWTLDQKRDREYLVTGLPNAQGVGYADYVLWGDDGKPLAVVEAKKTTVNPDAGHQQAKLYADGLERMHGQRPVIFCTNGYTTWIWDDLTYPPRRVAGFYKKDELDLLIRRREGRRPLDVARINESIVERYYQKRAIGEVCNALTQSRRKALLVMATGTGKTRTAIALIDLLQRAGWVKRALFLADRTALVRQATNAFKAHLPDSSPVNLVTEKDRDGRVYVCTYPTMMNLIDQTRGDEARFGVGYFDLIVIDEAHRSVYQRYGEIFRYFDASLVGLTATPRDQVDKNTYDLFELQHGVPTDAYELEIAVRDGFLVPYQGEQIDLKFPRQGIDYDQLSEQEKEQWESLDWGDDAQQQGVPRQVNAAAINRWLFNRDTVDKVLRHVMERGHKVEGGDRLGKTIVFARNQDHARYIRERFDHHYPHHAGHFARVISHEERYAENLIDDFSIKDKAPHLAISVDMLDTGIDVPEVVNLVFFKPVYSKIKFWQMIGRGTRLCPEVFGPGSDKENFRIFDFCFNFDFFRTNPNGIESSDTAPLATRLFRSRVRLIGHLQHDPQLEPAGELKSALLDRLHTEVASMSPDNFIVRNHFEAVERFQNREAWDDLSEDDRELLHREVAGLPCQIETDDIESRLFDLMALRMQLALVAGDQTTFEAGRKRVIEIAEMLEEKAAIPAVRARLDYLQRIQDQAFWVGMNLATLESMREQLRGLVPFIDKNRRQVVYTDFQDQVLGVRPESNSQMPAMTGQQYRKKVEDFLRGHMNHIVIHRLRKNESLTPSDLDSLERMITQIGDVDGTSLLSGLLAQSGSPSLAHFVRSMVGMDRAAAQATFATFLQDRSLTPPQIRFVEMLIDQLTSRGVIEASALYEPPFSDIHAGGPDALFAGREDLVASLFETLEIAQPSKLSGAG